MSKIIKGKIKTSNYLEIKYGDDALEMLITCRVMQNLAVLTQNESNEPVSSE